jgi:hypothetical protein
MPDRQRLVEDHRQLGGGEDAVEVGDTRRDQGRRRRLDRSGVLAAGGGDRDGGDHGEPGAHQ